MLQRQSFQDQLYQCFVSNFHLFNFTLSKSDKISEGFTKVFNYIMIWIRGVVVNKCVNIDNNKDLMTTILPIRVTFHRFQLEYFPHFANIFFIINCHHFLKFCIKFCT
jgi:hypothetical protein